MTCYTAAALDPLAIASSLKKYSGLVIISRSNVIKKYNNICFGLFLLIDMCKLLQIPHRTVKYIANLWENVTVVTVLYNLLYVAIS